MNRALLCGVVLLAALAAAADMHGPDLAGMDTQVAPGDDFFAYANGTWVKNTQIPPDLSAYGNGHILAELTTQRVNELLKATAAQSARPGTEAQQIGDYYFKFHG